MNSSRLFALLARRRDHKTAAPRWLGSALQTALGGAAGLGVGELEKRELATGGVPLGEIGREGLTLSNLGLGLSLGNPAMRRAVYGHHVVDGLERKFIGYDPKKFLTGVSAKAVLPAGVVLADQGIRTLGDTSSAVHNISDASERIKDTSGRMLLAATNTVDASRSVRESAAKGESTMGSLQELAGAASGMSHNVDSLAKTVGGYLPQLQMAGGAAAGGLAGRALSEALVGDDARDPKSVNRKRRLTLLATMLGAGAGAYGANRLSAGVPKTASIDRLVVGYARHFAGCAETRLR